MIVVPVIIFSLLIRIRATKLHILFQISLISLCLFPEKATRWR